MRWHLVKHAFRQTLGYSAMAGFMVAMSWLASAEEEMRWFSMIMSIEAVFILGPMLAMQALGGKEIFLRPVSRRELWQATWIAAIVVPAFIVTLAKVLGASLGAAISSELVPVRWDVIALSTLCDMTYAGFLLSFLAFSRYGPRWSALPPPARRFLGQIWTGCCFTAFVGGFVWVILARQYVPTSWSDIGPARVAVLAIAGAVALASFFLPMRPAPRPSTRTERIPRPEAAIAAPWRGGFAGVGGLRLIAQTEAWIFLIYLALQFVVICLLALFNAPWQGVPGQIRMVLTALFDRDSGFGIDLGVWPMLAMLIAIRHPFLPLLRRLRTLPISTRRLTAFLAGLPIAQASAMWAVLLAAHIAMTGAWPTDLRLDLLALIVGIAAASHALLIRTQAHIASFWMIVFVISMVRYLIRGIQTIHADVFIAGAGLILLAFAVVVNYRSLTERNEIFRMPVKPPVFASPGEGA